MQVVAINRSVRISPRKVRLMADVVRNLPVQKALDMLAVTGKRAAIDIQKTIKSAMSNATTNAKLDVTQLIISQIEVSQGPAQKRFRPSTRGRIHPYKKRTSHIRVVLSEKGGNK